MRNPKYESLRSYQLFKIRYALSENIHIVEFDTMSSAHFDTDSINAEIEIRGIRLTKKLVKHWWHIYNKGLGGRMEWRKPSGYNHWWDRNTVAAYNHQGGGTTVYDSLEAIISDIGEL